MSVLERRLKAAEAAGETLRLEKIRRDEEANRVDLSLLTDDTLEELCALCKTPGGVTAEGSINIEMFSKRAREDYNNAAMRSGGGR